MTRRTSLTEPPSFSVGCDKRRHAQSWHLHEAGESAGDAENPGWDSGCCASHILVCRLAATMITQEREDGELVTPCRIPPSAKMLPFFDISQSQSRPMTPARLSLAGGANY